MLDPNQLFGALRSACHEGRRDATHGEYLWRLVVLAESFDRHTYTFEWLPYLKEYDRRHRVIWPEATSVEMFHEMCRLLPYRRHRCKLTDAQHASIDALLDSPHLDALSSLSILYIEWAADGIRHLAEALCVCRGLKHLDLSMGHIQEAGFEQMCARSWPISLRSFALYHLGLRAEQIEQLTRSRFIQQLSGLHLGHNYFGDDGVKMLSELPNAWRSLVLEHNMITAQGAQALAQATTLSKLERLNLHANDIGAKGAYHLAIEGCFESLTSLNLRFNELHDEGVKHVARATAWPALRHLNVASNYTNTFGVEALCATTAMPGLESIELSHNHLGQVDLAAACKRSPWIHAVRGLGLEDCGLGPGHLGELLDPHQWPELRKLDVSRNMFSRTGFEQVRAMPARLQELGLSATCQGKDYRALAQLPWSPSLRRLELAQNDLGDEGVMCWAKGAKDLVLTHLDLSQNQLTNRAVEACLTELKLEQLRAWNLSHNVIEDRGVELLATSERLESLESLNVHYNAFEKAGHEALREWEREQRRLNVEMV